MLDGNKKSVFLVGRLTQEQFESIIFGDEGQGYKLVSFEEFLTSDRVVPQLQERVREYVEKEIRMKRSKNINMFLMDGEVTGIIKCTLSNWTGGDL